MAIPDHQALMLPLLEALSDGREHSLRALAGSFAKRFGLTEVERQSALPDAWWSEFYYRLKASSARLNQAGLAESPTPEFVRITDRGQNLLAKKPPASNSRFFLTRVDPCDSRFPRGGRRAREASTGWPEPFTPPPSAQAADSIRPL